MIYFDNASTSYPKPKEVVNGVNSIICNSAGSFLRTANTEKVDIIFKTRELIANLLNVKYPTSIIFTANATESLNSIIDGFLTEGDNVITTAIEHNSVVRPLIRLRREKNMYDLIFFTIFTVYIRGFIALLAFIMKSKVYHLQNMSLMKNIVSIYASRAVLTLLAQITYTLSTSSPQSSISWVFLNITPLYSVLFGNLILHEKN